MNLLSLILAGTGAFSIHAAKYFKTIIAVDVSEEMINVARTKAELRKISNIEFVQSGFLNFQPMEKADLVYTKWAFHHLPDYWKQAALLNINKMLKPNGLFLITDVIFKFTPDFENKTDALLEKLSTVFSQHFVEETKTHIREEYSTFHWILQGLIKRAGFTIACSDIDDELATEYFCRKTKDFPS